MANIQNLEAKLSENVQQVLAYEEPFKFVFQSQENYNYYAKSFEEKSSLFQRKPFEVAFTDERVKISKNLNKSLVHT